jgi:polar amino acid transport system substrate-binding protein
MNMTYRLKLTSLIAGAVIAATPGLVGASAGGFDLSPEQPNRVRATKSDRIIASIPKDFKFVKDGTLTIGISVGNPPLGTYATDAKTIVGSRLTVRSPR